VSTTKSTLRTRKIVVLNIVKKIVYAGTKSAGNTLTNLSPSPNRDPARSEKPGTIHISEPNERIRPQRITKCSRIHEIIKLFCHFKISCSSLKIASFLVTAMSTRTNHHSIKKLCFKVTQDWTTNSANLGLAYVCSLSTKMKTILNSVWYSNVLLQKIMVHPGYTQ